MPRGAPRLSIRVTSAVKSGSQPHWEPRPELRMDLNLELSESRDSDSGGARLFGPLIFSGPSQSPESESSFRVPGPSPIDSDHRDSS